MPKNSLLPFKISSIDSLGQGVSKVTDQITFIPKTLPGERGEALILAEKKGVQFAQMVHLLEASPHRIAPECQHFTECPSCHFQHTTYEEELHFKKMSLEKLMQKIPHPPLEVTGAPRRLAYRNRVQLHYDRKKKLMGMLDAKNQKILPIPFCLIAREPVKRAIQSLYQDEHWLSLAKDQPFQGHVEIYARDDESTLSWNQSYASGGFTQVFAEMNEELKKLIKTWSESGPTGPLLDLFAGNGNLSQGLSQDSRVCIDFYPQKVTDPFFSQDLYAPTALPLVRKKLQSLKFSPQLLILDPPRSGLKNLNEWLEAFSPKHVAYVSCDPHTLVRDILPLKNYEIKGNHLLDFFPSTFHYETFIFLERK